MDPVRNPYAPGAGTQPPELAGRDELRAGVRVSLDRIRAQRQSKSVLMVGLRGVGKTVLLNRLREDAEASGIRTMWIEAPEGRSLPAIISPQLRLTLINLSRVERAKAWASRGLRALASFIGAMRMKYGDVEVGLDMSPEPGLADNGDLEQDLQALFEVVGQAAKHADTALAIFIDELQYVEEDQLGALISAMHRVAQQSLPVVLVGAGLPQLRGRMGKAKSYAERLFDFPQIGPLPEAAARSALLKPARAQGVEFEPDALAHLVAKTQGYPYFLQEWGKHVWNIADRSPITIVDATNATESAVASMDENFFRVRFDRLTPAERKYLRAMSELGPGPHRSGDIAQELGRVVTSLGPTRGLLIKKGMIWSPNHGDTAFTVPLFDEFMRRTMPGDEWRR